MHPSKVTRFISNFALATLVAWMAGCASTGYEKGEKTASNVQNAANEIGALTGKIDKALASLTDLVEKPQPDLRPQFKQFISNLEAMESSAKRIGSARQAMGRGGKEFFAKWDAQLAQIKNEDIKARSLARKAEVEQELAAVKAKYSKATDDFKPFLSDLQDIRKFLSTDLTPGGLSAIKPTATKAEQDSSRLKVSVNQLADSFKKLGLALSPVGPPTAK